MEEQSQPLSTWFQYFLFAAGLVLFALVLIIAFSFKSENMRQKDRYITWYRQMDQKISRLAGYLKFAEKITVIHRPAGGLMLTYFETKETRSSLMPALYPKISLEREGSNLVLRKVKKGKVTHVSNFLENVTRFNVGRDGLLISLELGLKQRPSDRSETIFKRNISQARPQ